MNNYFDESYKHLVYDERGYVNDPDDSGGETYLGVTRRDHPNAKMWDIIDGIKKQYGLSGINNRLKNIPIINEEAKRIYKIQYWDAIKLDELNSKTLTHQIFDHAVNAGVGSAISLAYELVGLPKSTKFSNVLLNRLKEYGTR